MPRLSAKTVEQRETLVKNFIKQNPHSGEAACQNLLIKHDGMKMNVERLREVINLARRNAEVQPAPTPITPPIPRIVLPLGLEATIPAEPVKVQPEAPVKQVKPKLVYQDADLFGASDFKFHKGAKVTVIDIPSGIDPKDAWRRLKELSLIDGRDF